ncbi:hypothetical protein AUJ66_00540 [Candidatus Desantisbacteria bacterium CG1_02_38_46]|uniref:V-type ATP synthase subunit F n=3 Tax=unclassified Candidatus Desantisiibacteriota TaxID=3106372 RepID=A0A2H9PA38_9BACT|nr:MAG: hypothetical protein AUJ66_00540 [Candidatus Desantisbacteria bacterium CG1_02_38_46]PIU51697.1 MAG: hypothetical protein COS91_03045 [Candidatus Desantisbacteria bacterium CG07_land_8_20_14_0_80_39_15]PIZ15183.1 MAG: hypothetical protein COY51_06035 [Candidatus Desantisbacteria bacterium CG_4_10_14_0_8_um_filter_39_17]
MNKVAVIGVESSVLVFKFLNVDVFPVKDARGCVEVLRKIIGKYSIIFIDELFIDEASSLISESDRDIAMTIIPLPLQGRSSGNAVKRIKDFIRKAMGISVS